MSTSSFHTSFLPLTCPACEHTFQAESARLSASYGWVDCPACGHVFSADNQFLPVSTAKFNILPLDPHSAEAQPKAAPPTPMSEERPHQLPLRPAHSLTHAHEATPYLSAHNPLSHSLPTPSSAISGQDAALNRESQARRVATTAFNLHPQPAESKMDDATPLLGDPFPTYSVAAQGARTAAHASAQTSAQEQPDPTEDGGVAAAADPRETSSGEALYRAATQLLGLKAIGEPWPGPPDAQGDESNRIEHWPAQLLAPQQTWEGVIRDISANPTAPAQSSSQRVLRNKRQLPARSPTPGGEQLQAHSTPEPAEALDRRPDTLAARPSAGPTPDPARPPAPPPVPAAPQVWRAGGATHAHAANPKAAENRQPDARDSGRVQPAASPVPSKIDSAADGALAPAQDSADRIAPTRAVVRSNHAVSDQGAKEPAPKTTAHAHSVTADLRDATTHSSSQAATMTPKPQFAAPRSAQALERSGGVSPAKKVADQRSLPSAKPEEVAKLLDWLEESEPKPLLRRPAFWVTSLLTVALGLAVLISERNRWVAMWPSLRAPLNGLCVLAVCTVEDFRDLSAIELDGTTLTKQPDVPNRYLLEVSIVNKARYTAVALPSLEITLTTFDGKPIISRRLSARELGFAHKTLAPLAMQKSEFVVDIVLSPDEQLRMENYVVRAFYAKAGTQQ